jgi:crossover junction endodeoxyribonuclease RuvC
LQKPLIILGIDPGTLIMGYSVIEASKSKFTIKTIDVLKLASKKDPYERLQLIHSKVMELVTTWHPDEFAIEAPFFGKNVQSMLKLGRAQGVAIAAAMSASIPVTEYAPKKVKQAITGNGNADKEQLWKMLQRITSLPDKPKYFDATDALAVAICHFYGSRSVQKKTTGAKVKSKGGWEKFIQDNGHRVKP